jgi:hypothetical protein
MTLDRYEESALAEIHKFKHPDETFWGRVGGIVGKPFEWAADGAMWTLDAFGLKRLVDSAMQGFLSLVTDGAAWTVQVGAIRKALKEVAGRDINDFQQGKALHLCDCDKAIAGMATKYKLLATAEGFGCGMAGLPGIPVDIVALLSLNLRAIAETAVYYGFDPELEHERVYALLILGLGATGSGASEVAAKQVLIAECAKVTKAVAQRVTWKKLEDMLLVRVAQRVFERLGVRLTKQKLAEAVPVAGAAIGAGVNALFTANVCFAAYMMYRERHLVEKHGLSVLKE